MTKAVVINLPVFWPPPPCTLSKALCWSQVQVFNGLIRPNTLSPLPVADPNVPVLVYPLTNTPPAPSAAATVSRSEVGVPS